jgi:hypothetical protein
MTSNAREAFARALTAKDKPGLRALLADEIEFRALAPNRGLSGSPPREAVDEIILGRSFEPSDKIRRQAFVLTDSFADRENAADRQQVHNADDDLLIEEQDYFTTDETGRIASTRVLCSGYPPAPEPHRDRLAATTAAGGRG